MTNDSIWDMDPSDLKNKEETASQEKKEEEKKEKTLEQIMSNLPESPDHTQIEAWKQQHGEVFCSGFSPTEMYVFRPLTREEFVQVQTIMQSGNEQFTQLDLEEQIVRRCLLWSSTQGTTALKNKGGSFSTLHEQILQNSNFINPALASQLVMKL